MRDRPIVNGRGKTALQTTRTIIVACDILNAGRSDRVHRETILRARIEFMTQIIQRFTAQRCDLFHTNPLSRSRLPYRLSLILA